MSANILLPMDDYCSKKSAILAWPWKNNRWTDDAVPVQKQFARLAMALSMAVPVFVIVPTEFLDRARFIIPHHINFVPAEVPDVLQSDVGQSSFVLADKQISLNIPAKTNKEIKSFFNNVAQIAMMSVNESACNSLELLSIMNEKVGIFQCYDHEEKMIDEKYLKKIYPQDFNLICLRKNLNWDYRMPLARFIRPGEILVNSVPTKHYLYDYFLSIEQFLKDSLSSLQTNLIIHRIPLPASINNAIIKQQSYLDFLMANERVVIPLSDPKQDNEVMQLFASIFPDCEPAGVQATEFIKAGQSFHDAVLLVPHKKN